MRGSRKKIENIQKQQNSPGVTSFVWGSLPLVYQSLFSSFFYITLTRASGAHDEKITYLMLLVAILTVLILIWPWET